jgi:hypothetical protein
MSLPGTQTPREEISLPLSIFEVPLLEPADTIMGRLLKWLKEGGISIAFRNGHVFISLSIFTIYM